MAGLIDIPVSTVTSLSAERAVLVIRALLRSECGYAKLSPAALTISSRLTVADGGIDAEIDVPAGAAIPEDCIFQKGLSGFQIKSGTAFKPWTDSAIRSELLGGNKHLRPEVERLVQRRGRYLVLCTGHDFTPEQRNESRQLICNVLAEAGFPGYDQLVEVLGASQLVEFTERYPGTASLLAIDPIQEAWVLEEWERDAHLANRFEASTEQTQLIERIRARLLGDAKHLRILGEPGVGKTRIVLEAVKDQSIAPYVLYLQHGSRFGQTKLFRQLLKAGWDKPLVLVLDELPEAELSDIWRHLKPRCGRLKILSLDHGRDHSHDTDIERLDAPRLPDDVIKKILSDRVGALRELDRWVAMCEGSPRVAQAVADNLYSNPDDLLRPPATVPIWARFLHGYGTRDDGASRQVDCVTQHLALFSRFGYEEPVATEAAYIADLVKNVDPTVGWARFQEIVLDLRSRRVLQGSRTLFFVPKALHIYLWRQFWERYGRGFNFAKTFTTMPSSLHTWFLNMFKFAGSPATAHVVADVLRPDGMFSERAVLTSAYGARFLSTLAEANPAAVLDLLEATIGRWTDEEIFAFRDERQSIVWTLEKIAVWPALTVRAIQLLARLAVNENADFSNNATGTMVGLFRIGPEAAATEASPAERLPALLSLLRSPDEAPKRLALKAVDVALENRNNGYRVVGPEFQGLKGRAKLWVPPTYGDWWDAKLLYFRALVDETSQWPQPQRPGVCQSLLRAAQHQLRTPPCTELAFEVLDVLLDDPAMEPRELNRFFSHWHEYEEDDQQAGISARLRGMARHYAQRSLASRVQRYVIDVDWMEWDEGFRKVSGKPPTRIKCLVAALARRIARKPELIAEVEQLLAPAESTQALWYFGEQLALVDGRTLLPALTRLAERSRHQVCLHGYLSSTRKLDADFYHAWVQGALKDVDTAWLGATIALSSEFESDLFALCLDALENDWIDALLFAHLRYGNAIESVPSTQLGRLFRLLENIGRDDSLRLLVELLDSIAFGSSFACDADFVFRVVVRTIPVERREQMHGYHWKSVCAKLVRWEVRQSGPLLDALLEAMGKSYQFSYDTDVVLVTGALVRLNPSAAWTIVRSHLEASLPQWRSDVLSWLKGGLSSFDEKDLRGPICDMPVSQIIDWIEIDVVRRAPLIAYAVPASLDDVDGGQLTRELLTRYGQIEGVGDGISATFHSGGWTGPTSAYLRRKRERLRGWLGAALTFPVTQWIESEIKYLDGGIEREEVNEERSRYD